MIPAKQQDADKFIIRRATRDDADVLIAFNQAMASETEGKALPDNIISNGVRRLFDLPHSGFYIVCESRNDIVGALMVTFEWSDWRNGYFWWIQSVYVRPDFRRKGVFRNMYAYIKQVALDSNDACGLRLYVDKHNINAQNTYTAMGMTETEYRLYEEEFSTDE